MPHVWLSSTTKDGFMRKIDKIIVHCSATPSSMDIGMIEINQWHSEKPEYNPAPLSGYYCGYHWVIRRNGLIESGRLDDEIGAHCKGQNKNSIGICMVGEGQYTQDQWKSLFWLIEQKLNHYGLEVKNVFGHYEFNPNKTCPNFTSMDRFRDDLEMYLKGGLK